MPDSQPSKMAAPAPDARPRAAARLKLGSRLGLFLVSIATLVIIGSVVRNQLFYNLRIDGPAYQQIARRNELLDDFDPKSQVIDGAFVSMDQLVELAAANDTVGVSKQIATIETSRAEYLSRRQYWLEHDLGDLHLTVLMDRAARPALAIFQRFDTDLLPAISHHDYRLARRVLNGPIDSLFRAHKDHAGEVRERAGKLVHQEELGVERSVRRWTVGLAVGTLVMIVALFVVAWGVLLREVITPLREASRHVAAIEQGNYEVAIDTTRGDEIGDVLVALDSMRRTLRSTTTALQATQEQVRLSEERFALAMRGTNEGIWDWNMETNSVYMSPRFITMLGYEHNEIERSVATFHSLVHPEDSERVVQALGDYFAGQTAHFQSELRLRHEDGHYMPFLARAAVSRMPDGKPTRMVGTILDLTELHRVKSELDVAEQRYRDIVEHSPEGIYQSTLDGHLLMVNSTCARLFGYDDPAEFLAATETTKALYVEPERREHFLVHIQQDDTIVGFQAQLRKKDGSAFWSSNSARVVRDIDGQIKYVEGFLEDITARRQQEETIMHLATHDPLTELPNRRGMNDALERAIERAKQGERSAFVLIDLDNFKAINDSVGHPAGDRFLQQIGGLLKRVLRPGDTIARFGGDEFAVLLDAVNARRSRAVAERLRNALAGFRFQEGTYTFAPTASMGIALIEDGGQDPTNIVSIADGALHMAKEEGKNRCVVYSALTERETKFTEASQWATRIQDALREDRFALHFQPIVRIADGGVAYYEALIRLREADGSLTMPGAFIPAAERFGLASAVDEWVIKAVLRSLLARPRAPICVNISGASLGDEMLLARLERYIASANLAAGQLVFEITETAVVHDLERARHWMERLSKLGCRFALDDFGTGFSSFSYLRSLPVDEVKIDGSFIQTVGTDDSSLAVVQAITSLAHALGKRVIAEWVESRAIATKLATLGVDYGQGYLWPTLDEAQFESGLEQPDAANSRRIG